MENLTFSGAAVNRNGKKLSRKKPKYLPLRTRKSLNPIETRMGRVTRSHPPAKMNKKVLYI